LTPPLTAADRLPGVLRRLRCARNAFTAIYRGLQISIGPRIFKSSGSPSICRKRSDSDMADYILSLK
jgi:hypothetical protein